MTLKAVQVTAGINSCPLFLKTTADTLFTISSTTKAKDNETRFSWLFGNAVVVFGPSSDLTTRAPDSARIKSKMLYASTKDALKKKLVGIGTEIQATDLSEIDYQTVFDKVVRI